MGLIDQFNRIYNRFFPAAGRTTSDEAEPPPRQVRGSAMGAYQEARLQRDRRPAAEDRRAMYKDDPDPGRRFGTQRLCPDGGG